MGEWQTDGGPGYKPRAICTRIWGLRTVAWDPERRQLSRFAHAMPFSVTQRERTILAVIALLVVLGLIGLAVL